MNRSDAVVADLNNVPTSDTSCGVTQVDDRSAPQVIKDCVVHLLGEAETCIIALFCRSLNAAHQSATKTWCCLSSGIAGWAFLSQSLHLGMCLGWLCWPSSQEPKFSHCHLVHEQMTSPPCLAWLPKCWPLGLLLEISTVDLQTSLSGPMD